MAPEDPMSAKPIPKRFEHLSNPCLFFVQKVSPIDGTSGVRLPPIAKLVDSGQPLSEVNTPYLCQC